jgi:hypothetical protein
MSKGSVMRTFAMVKFLRMVRKLSEKVAMASREEDSVFAGWHTFAKGRARQMRLHIA